MTAPPLRPAAFLDRDGVINVDGGYVHRWESFEFLPSVTNALHRLAKAGYALVIVTNQSGIARGYFSQEEYLDLSRQLTDHLRRGGISLDGIYHCPHHPEGVVAEFATTCDCRKPEPGLILRAIAELGLDPARSFMAGDKASDIAAARAAGLGRAYLIGPAQDAAACGSDLAFATLSDCVDHVLAPKQGAS